MTGQDDRAAHDVVGRFARAAERPPSTLEDTRVMALVLDGAEHHECQSFYDLDQVAGRLGLSIGQSERRLVDSVAHELAWRLEDAGLMSTYRLEQRCIGPTVRMIHAGLRVDVNGWRALLDARRWHAHSCRYRLFEATGGDNGEAVGRYLATRGHHLKGTGKEALSTLRSDPIVGALLELRRTEAFLGDLGAKVLAAASSDPDGRVHPMLDPLGTATGRFSATAPNLLGLENTPEVRGLVIAPPGHVLISADYSAADLRALSVIADDRALRAVFQEGRDPHRETAAIVFRVAQDDLTESQRKAAKAVNFATVYGAGTEGIQKYALTTLGVEMSSKDALKFRTLFLHHYAGVAAWQREVSGQKRTEARSLGGRLRRGLDSTPARLNSPVQMTTADALKIAIVRLDTMLAELGASILLPVHDELLVEAPECRAQEVADLVEREMSDAMGGLLDWMVPASVDVGIGASWADAAGSK